MTTTYDKHRSYWKKKLSISPVLTGMMQLKSTDCVLDVGCGNGRLAAYAADQRVTEATGLDYSGELLQSAREAFPGLVFVQGDANNPDDLLLNGKHNVFVSNVAIRKDGVRLPDLLEAAELASTLPERCYFRIQGERDLPNMITSLPLYSEAEISEAFGDGWNVEIQTEIYQQKFTDEAYFRTFLERIGLELRESALQGLQWPHRFQRHYYCVAAMR